MAFYIQHSQVTNVKVVIVTTVLEERGLGAIMAERCTEPFKGLKHPAQIQ